MKFRGNFVIFKNLGVNLQFLICGQFATLEKLRISFNWWKGGQVFNLGKGKKDFCLIHLVHLFFLKKI